MIKVSASEVVYFIVKTVCQLLRSGSWFMTVCFLLLFCFFRIFSLVVLGYCTSIVNLTLKAMKCMLHHLLKLGKYSWRLQHSQVISIGSRSLPSITLSHVSDNYIHRTCVNGKLVEEKTKVKHGDRILWGNNHYFRINCPRLPGV